MLNRMLLKLNNDLASSGSSFSAMLNRMLLKPWQFVLVKQRRFSAMLNRMLLKRMTYQERVQAVF